VGKAPRACLQGKMKEGAFARARVDQHPSTLTKTCVNLLVLATFRRIATAEQHLIEAKYFHKIIFIINTSQQSSQKSFAWPSFFS
jgi:hypothetical protein